MSGGWKKTRTNETEEAEEAQEEEEALQLMHVGDKWKVTLPSELAYGERSPSPVIPPNSVLVFEMELISIAPTEE